MSSFQKTRMVWGIGWPLLVLLASVVVPTPGGNPVRGDEGKQIAAGKPQYHAKEHEAWAEKGRIVGQVKDCPGCEVKALDAKTKKAVRACKVKPGGKTYELEWLQPGEYILLVMAKGYGPHDVHKLVVKAKHDLRVDLEF